MGSYLMYPLYIKYFTVEQFGYNDLFNKTAILLSILISFRIFSAMSNYYFDYAGNPDEKRKFVGSLFSFTVVSALALGGILLFAGKYLTHYFRYTFTLSAVAIASQISVTSLYIFYLRNDSILKKFFFYNFLSITTLLAWQYIAMVHFGQKFDAIIEIRGIHAFILMVITMIILYFKFGFAWNLDILKKCLLYSIGLLPFIVINWGQLYIDRWYMQSINGAYAVGIYTFYFTIAIIHSTISDAYENAWRPTLIQQFKDGEQGFTGWKKNVHMYLLLSNTTAACAVLGTTLLPFVIDMHPFQPYLYIIFPIMILASMKSHLLLFLQPLIYLKKSLILSIFVSVQLVLLLICYFIWLKLPDLNTLLTINLVIAAIILIATFAYSQVVHKMPFQPKMFLSSAMFIVSCLAGWYFTMKDPSKAIFIANIILGIQLLPILAKIFNPKKFSEMDFDL